MRRIVVALAAAASLAPAVFLGGAAPAYAGGANLHPVQDRYEPGDIATFVGYVTPSTAGGWVADAPYSTFAVSVAGARALLGTLAFEPAPRLGPGVLRASLTAKVPDDLATGHYELLTCNQGCAKGLGDLAGGTLHVGVDPIQTPITREWPPDEPEIANLPPGARVVMPPVGEPPVRSGSPAPAPAPPPAAAAAAVPARPVGSHRPEASPTALALGGALAAICTGLVLIALREG